MTVAIRTPQLDHCIATARTQTLSRVDTQHSRLCWDGGAIDDFKASVVNPKRFHTALTLLVKHLKVRINRCSPQSFDVALRKCIRPKQVSLTSLPATASCLLSHRTGR